MESQKVHSVMMETMVMTWGRKAFQKLILTRQSGISMQASVGGSNGQIVDVFTVIQVIPPCLLFDVAYMLLFRSQLRGQLTLNSQILAWRGDSFDYKNIKLEALQVILHE